MFAEACSLNIRIGRGRAYEFQRLDIVFLPLVLLVGKHILVGVDVRRAMDRERRYTQEAYIPQKYRHQLVRALIGVEAMFKKVNLQCVMFASDPFLYQSTPLK